MAGRRVVHVSSHSFTPVLDGRRRNADIGLLYDPARPGERALCARWTRTLGARVKPLRVRRNYPYEGKNDGLTSHLRRRFSAAQYVGVEIEINQKHVLRNRLPAALERAVIGSLREAIADVSVPARVRRANHEDHPLKIRFGYELVYQCPQPTPMILMLNVHYSRVSDMITPDHIVTTPSLPQRGYRDSFGNWCTPHRRPGGRDAHHHRCDDQRQRTSRRGQCGSRADADREPSRRDAGVSARQQVLRDRSADADGVEHVRRRRRRDGRA